MKTKHLIAAMALALTIAACPVWAATTADDFLKAYFLIQEGDAAEKTGDSPQAITKYSEALDILRTIKRNYPDWDPKIISYRISYCSGKIDTNREHMGVLNEQVKVQMDEVKRVLMMEQQETQKRLDKLEQENIKLHGALEQREKELQDAMQGKKQMNEAEKSILDAERILDDAVRDYELKTGKSSPVRVQIDQHFKGGEGAVAPVAPVAPETGTPRAEALDKENAVLKAQITKLETELSAFKVGNLTHDDQLQNLTKENQTLRTKLNEAEDNYNSAETATAELVAMKAELAETQKKLESAQKDLQTVLVARDDLTIRLKQAEEEMAGLRANPQELNAMKIELAQKQDELDRAQAMLETALDKERKVRTELTASQVVMARENVALRSVVNELQAHYRKNPIRGGDPMQTDFTQTQEQLQALQSECDKLKTDNAQLRDGRDAVQKELEQARAQVAELEKGFQQKIDSGTATPSEMIMAHEKVKQELADARIQINQLSEMKEKYEALRSAYANTLKELEQARSGTPALVASPVERPAPVVSDAGGEGTTVVKAVPSVPAPSETDAGEVLPAGGYTGSVVLLNPKENFVIVNFQPGNVPPLKSEMGVYRENVYVGSVRITDPIKPPLASADVVSGTLQRGDVVR